MNLIKISFLFFLAAVSLATPLNGRTQSRDASDTQDKYIWKQASSGGYTYRYVTNDPRQTRFYTLSNGLTVMLSVNHKSRGLPYGSPQGPAAIPIPGIIPGWRTTWNISFSMAVACTCGDIPGRSTITTDGAGWRKYFP